MRHISGTVMRGLVTAMKFGELVAKLSAESGQTLRSQGNADLELVGIAAVNEATRGIISYIEGGKFASQINTTEASALILPKDAELQAQATNREIAWVEVGFPRLAFAQAIALFYQPLKPAPGIHPTAVIDPTVELGQAVSIGAHAVIQAGSKLGDEVCIHPNVVIYPQVHIGDRTILHANCVIHERTQIGANCIIQPGAVLGAEGFGFVPIPSGWYKMQQSGVVVLEEGVEIGCNSAVDRPSVGETRIGRNTKIDNLVQIAHGCRIGENCALAGQVGLAGGVIIGNRVIMGGQAGVANQSKVGDGVQAAARAGILSDVNPGDIVIGTPAIAIKTFYKAAAVFPHLPEMRKAIRELQKLVDGLIKAQSQKPD
jgi:UDP-3-O-[3-hydroxymyristoyl] glucosamine N-acyltransferase